MTVGETTTGSLGDAMPAIVGQCRVKSEFVGTWERTCEINKQTPNTGVNWTEFTLNAVDRQGINKTTDNRNFQQLSGSLQSIEPTMNQIIIKVTDRTYRKIASVVKSKVGGLASDAMTRGDDEDYL